MERSSADWSAHCRCEPLLQVLVRIKPKDDHSKRRFCGHGQAHKHHTGLHARIQTAILGLRQGVYVCNDGVLVLTDFSPLCFMYACRLSLVFAKAIRSADLQGTKPGAFCLCMEPAHKITSVGVCAMLRFVFVVILTIRASNQLINY